MDNAESIVKFEHISVQFPSVLANDDVSLEIKKGEVFALVGENGAGKSTLMKVLYGMNEPVAGKVYIKGELITKYNPSEAIRLGVGMVHQHFMLVPSFTVAENIVMCKEPMKNGIFFDEKGACEIVENLVREYGLKVSPKDRIDRISVGLQQRVEILKTLYRGADILILDEPTAVLTPQETDELFDVIRRIVREKQMTVIIITHKLYEVMAISDRVGVMRRGKLVGVEQTKNVNERILASMMVGREVLLPKLERKKTSGEELINIKSLTVLDNRSLEAVKNLSLSVHAGEIVGIAGIEGNGQSELVEAITGLRQYKSGSITICGKDIKGMTPGKIRDIGVSHIPEDRMTTGVSLSASIEDNLISGKHKAEEFAVKGIHMKRKPIREYAKRLFEEFDIRSSSVEISAGSLSGGNMQKVVLAREIAFENPVIIISQPTRGVDIGAMEFIHKLIIDERNKGCAILLVSADLDELFALSDRIVTIYEGRITGEFVNGEIDKSDIGYYMTNASKIDE